MTSKASSIQASEAATSARRAVESAERQKANMRRRGRRSFPQIWRIGCQRSRWFLWHPTRRICGKLLRPLRRRRRRRAPAAAAGSFDAEAVARAQLQLDLAGQDLLAAVA